MKRSTIIILTIVSTILSLLFILATYFGWIRFLEMHMSKSEKYIENYSSLPKANENRRVVLSFTVNDKTISKLKPMINSILDQTVKVNDIILCVPYKFMSKIPKYVKNIATIIPCGKDYGTANKLIPALLREKESNSIIIALNENKVYGKDFIESMVTNAEKQGDCCIVTNEKSAILVIPEALENDVLDYTSNRKYDEDWFLKKSKNSDIFEYTENFSVW